MEIVSSSKTSLDSQKPPPTEMVAYLGSPTSYTLGGSSQTMTWILSNGVENLTVCQSWQIWMQQPESLLKFVRCKCKLSSKKSMWCSCCKNGLKFVTACGDCWWESCTNAEEVILDIEEENIGTDEEAILLFPNLIQMYLLGCLLQQRTYMLCHIRDSVRFLRLARMKFWSVKYTVRSSKFFTTLIHT